MEYKVGDRVRIGGVKISDSSSCVGFSAHIGDEGTITQIQEGEHFYVRFDGDRYEYGCYSLSQMLPVDSFAYSYSGEIKPKKTIMKTLNTMMKKLLDADTQTLVKAGYINGDLELTSEGRDALNIIVFEQNKAALVVLAQAVLDEEKAK